MHDPDSNTVRQLLRDLRDVNKERRRTAVMKLGMVGGEDAVRALIMRVQDNYEDLIVRGRAALMLGKLGDARALEPLIRALDAPGYQTPMNAAEALGNLGDARAIEPLLVMMETARGKTRDAALRALKKLGHDYDEETSRMPIPEA